jgi:hypothetical protein
MLAGIQLRVLGISPGIGVFLWLAGAASAQNIVVDAAPSHAVNSFSPFRALGGAIDRLRGGVTREENEKHTERLLTDPVLKELLGAGWQTVTYRQNTELMIEAWHWNARGTWSNAAKQEGYFTGSAEPTNEKILHSWAYPLPHRGATLGDGNGWSRLDRWRSEILLEEQSLSDQGLHRRDRCHASAVGHDRFGRQGGRQCRQDSLGQPLRQALLRAVLDGRTRAFL